MCCLCWLCLQDLEFIFKGEESLFPLILGRLQASSSIFFYMPFIRSYLSNFSLMETINLFHLHIMRSSALLSRVFFRGVHENQEGQTVGCEAKMLFWGVTAALLGTEIFCSKCTGQSCVFVEDPSVRITYMGKGFSELFPNRNIFNRENGLVCIFEICI